MSSPSSSSNAERSRARPPPLVSQMVAMSYSYRLIIFALFIGPVSMIVVPTILTTMFLFLDSITLQHTVPTIIMTVVSTKILNDKIATSAPTKRQAEQSLQTNWMIRALMMFLLCIMVTRSDCGSYWKFRRCKQIFNIFNKLLVCCRGKDCYRYTPPWLHHRCTVHLSTINHETFF